MSPHSTSSRLVVEVSRRGRLVTGEPYFTPGVPLQLEVKGHGEVAPGDLAVVRTGRGRARVEEVIGPADRVENVLEALLVQRGARTPFERQELPEIDVSNRVDLRDLLTYTVDPETAKDFDDALSFRREVNGIRAWVHIADVSYFVGAGTPLDRGAAGRALSTYVPGTVAPMLPPELADDACSLRPHKDRLCVTVELPPGGGPPEFYRSVIRSDARLSYGEAERREAPPPILEALALNDELASALREERFARGALQVQTPEVAFRFDGRGGVADAWLEGEPHAHMLVEELMILANERVGSLLASRRRDALYRVHERPDPQAVEQLVAKLTDLGVPTPPVPERLSPQQAAVLAGETSKRVARYVEQSGRGREAFPALVLRALKQARYDPANLGHSGLASTAYCHFTSPIRRYPDLVVHRALLRELGLSDDPEPDDLPFLAEHASEREREAARLEYLADDICLAWLLERRLFERGWEEPWAGEVTGLIGSGLFVRFGEVFEGFLPARRLHGEFFELNPLGTALAGRTTGRKYRLGDPLEVRVESIARNEGKVELALG
ncbi:MAG: RNB domain-containing ribonuclease [Actinomycetota bacterium]|nr:RNB domain-containing ribonuclease [Actinomycetota bacterium]